MGSGCDILLTEPDRFVGYLLSDKNIRSNVYDKDSLVLIMRTALRNDPSLSNVLDDIDKSGDDLGVCLGNVINNRTIQSIIQQNIDKKRKYFRQRVRRQRPSLKGSSLKKEVERRLNISLSKLRPSSTKVSKQVTIADATRPIKVGSYKRSGKKVGNYRRSYRGLTNAERMLIENNISKTPSQVYDIYIKSGLKFRSRKSIKTHYYRIKRSLKKRKP